MLPEIPELGNPTAILSWLRNETTEGEFFNWAGEVVERYVRFLHPEAKAATVIGKAVFLLPQPKAYRLPDWLLSYMDRLNDVFERRRRYLTRDEVLDILKEYAHGGQAEAYPDLQPRGGLAGHA